LSNQLLAVVMLSALALFFKGNISPVTTHAQGPQLFRIHQLLRENQKPMTTYPKLKKKPKKQVNATKV
jgi:hypothetical protein